MKTCASFVVARPDDPMAEPLCFLCRTHRRQHAGKIAKSLNDTEDRIARMPLPGARRDAAG